MKLKRKILLGGLFSLTVLTNQAYSAVIPVAAGSLTDCPIVGAARSCALQYRFNADGSVDTLVDNTVPSTDRIEDTLVGVINNSGSVQNSIALSDTSLPIFGFDSDGQSTIPNPGNLPGSTYFGQYFSSVGALLGTTTFSGISADTTSGIVNFPGLPSGGHGWWVLEEQVSFTNPPTATPSGPTVPTNTPIPGAMWLFGSTIFAYFGLRNKKSK